MEQAPPLRSSSSPSSGACQEGGQPDEAVRQGKAPTGVSFRTITAPPASSDLDAVAALHFASWKVAYVNVFPEEYLVDGGALEQQMRRMWADRAQNGIPDTSRWLLLVAEGSQGELAGFVCVNATEEREHGILLDNLHVAPAFRRRGIAKELVRRAAAWVRNTYPGEPMHLTCLDTNTGARAFYEAQGGSLGQGMLWEPEGGRPSPCVRYVWPAEKLPL